MKIKISPFISIIIFMIIFFIFFKGLQNSNIYTPNLKIEKNIPSFKAKTFNNDKFISEKIFQKDKFYLLNIWASWCVPCRDEHSFLTNLNKEEKIEIIGLNYKDDKKSAKNFLKELTNPYDVILLDEDGTVAIEWGAYGVPESFLIYDNKIVKKIIGPINEELLSEIKILLQ